MSSRYKFVIFCAAALTAALANQASAAFTTGTFTTSSQLDVSGVFPVAENEAGDAGGPGNGGGTVLLDDVTFVSGGTTSIRFSNPSGGSVVGSTFSSEFEINQLMRALIYKASTSSADQLTGSVPIISGAEYKLQLLFHNNDGAAVFNPWSIVVEGDTLANFQALNGSTQPGQVVTYGFVATDTTLNISLFSQGGANNDTVYLSAFSLEQVPEPSTALLLAVGGMLLRRRR